MATAADKSKAIKKATKKSTATKRRSAAPKKKPQSWQDKSPGVMRDWIVKLSNGNEKQVRAHNGVEAIQLASGTVEEMRKEGRPIGAVELETYKREQALRAQQKEAEGSDAASVGTPIERETGGLASAENERPISRRGVDSKQ